MADNVEMQGLEFQIVNDSAAAVQGIDSLKNALTRLKTATRSSTTGLSKTAQGIRELSNSLKGLNSGDASQKITRLANALTALSQVGNVKISSSIANQLTAINTALGNLKWTDGDKLTALANGLRPLSELGKANMTTFINQLGKLPTVIEELDKADLDKFIDQMNRLAAAMKPFADEMQKVSNGFSAFPSKIQKLITSTEKYNASAQKATTTTGKFSTGLKALNVAALAVTFRKISHWVAQAVTESNKYQEDLNLFTVALGQYAAEAQNYAEKVSDVLGIDPAEWLRNQGIFMTLGTGMGVASDKAAVMSKNLTQLGYDISSFFNISIEDSMQKLQSAISGELEPVRRLGYALSQNNLQELYGKEVTESLAQKYKELENSLDGAGLAQLAVEMGFDRSISTMTEAEKVQLRYIALMKQNTIVQGDMARTLEAPANQLRILQAQVTQAARAIGNIFIPALNAILPYAIAVVQVIREIADALANLAGFKLTEVDYSGVSSAAVGAGELADNLGDAASAAKKLKQYTLGFDELNVFSPNTASGSGAGAGVGAGGFDFELPTYDFLGDAVTKRVNELKGKLEPIVKIVLAIAAGFAAWKIGSSIVSSITAISTALSAIGKMGFVQTILSKIAGAVAGMALQFSVAGGGIKGFLSVLGLIAKTAAPVVVVLMVIISTLKVLIECWDGIKNAVKDSLSNLKVGERLAALRDNLNRLGEKLGWVDGFWNGLKETVGILMDFIGSTVITVLGGLLIGVFNSLITIVDGLVTAVSGVVDIFKALIKFFKGAFTGDIDLIKESLTLFGTGISEVFMGIFTVIWGGLSDFILGVIEGISNLGSTLFGELLPPIIEGITTGFDTLCDNIALFFNNAWQLICALWSLTGDWFNINVITPVSNFFDTLCTKISSFFSNAWVHVQGVWGVVTNWFDSTIITPVKTAFDQMCQAVGGFFSSLWGNIVGVFAGAGTWFQINVVDAITLGFKNMVNGAIGLFEGMINGLIVGLNWVIDKVNSVLSVFGNDGFKHLDKVTIPRLANGGFVDEGQLFIAREAGAEMVGAMGRRTAVANNDQIVEGISAGVSIANDGVISAIYALINAVEEKDMVVNVGDNEIGQSYDRYKEKRGRQVSSGVFANAY